EPRRGHLSADFHAATLPWGRHEGVKPAPPAADTGSPTWDVGPFRSATLPLGRHDGVKTGSPGYRHPLAGPGPIREFPVRWFGARGLGEFVVPGCGFPPGDGDVSWTASPSPKISESAPFSCGLARQVHENGALSAIKEHAAAERDPAHQPTPANRWQGGTNVPPRPASP